MDIVKILENRYSTKEFDPTREIDSQTMQNVKILLQKAPSSTNIQPWHFIIAQSKEAKLRVAKSTQGFFKFNEPKVINASAVIVFSSRVAADSEYLRHLIDNEDIDGRFLSPENRAQTDAGRVIFSNIHKYDLKDQQHWLDKQLYLNLGNFLLGVAALGLDALPMEGCDLKELNNEFKLTDKGYTASFLVAIGYRAESDFNASLPKSRLPIDEIIEML